jgi:glycosyltransferase involved in cell wall biosynthesis
MADFSLMIAPRKLSRLVLVCSKWPPQYGGPGIYYYRNMPFLRSLADHVHVVTRRGDLPPATGPNEPGVTFSTLGSPCTRIGQYLFGAKVAAIVLWHAIKMRSPCGVIFAGGNAMNGWREAATLLPWVGVPIIVENVLITADDGDSILRTRFRGFTRFAARRLRSFCPVSTGLLESVERAFPEATCTLLPYGVDLEANAPPTDAAKSQAREALGLPTDAFITITLGAVHERKGQLPLIEAWLEWIRATGETNARLLVVGPRETPAYSQRIDEVVAAAGSHGATVVFTGQTADSAKYLRAADVYVTASHAEGLPISIVEALAHGLPVACRGLEGVTNDFMYGHAVTPISPWSVEAFAAAMNGLHDVRVRHVASRDARDVAEQRFDVRRRVAALGELFTV